jgi:hypothetical protein
MRMIMTQSTREVGFLKNIREGDLENLQAAFDYHE